MLTVHWPFCAARSFPVAGARRYLLRLETSNPELYAALHPDAMSWQRRVDCLKALQEVGFMVRPMPFLICRCVLDICTITSPLCRHSLLW